MSGGMGLFIPEIPAQGWLAIFAAAVTVMNLFGLTVTNRANFVMTAIMGAAVILFVIAAASALHGGAGEGLLFSPKPFYNRATFSFPAVMGATSIAAFSFLGFDGISTSRASAWRMPLGMARARLLPPQIFAPAASGEASTGFRGAAPTDLLVNTTQD